MRIPGTFRKREVGKPVAWKILDHTADAGFEAEADTLAEIFLDAAEAFLFIAAGPAPGDFSETGEFHTFFLSAVDGEELAVSWLNELLFLAETRSVFFLPVKVTVSLSPPAIAASGRTVPLNGRVLSVKAATYGGLVLRTSPRPFLRMILDL
jgi:SHS2 domain-containing protein